MDKRPHRNFDVWEKAISFVKEVYQATDNFPKSEIDGLISQMRRTAVSIPSNLAEGAARKGKKEFKHFLNIAQGSISELDTQIELAMMLKYVDKNVYNDMMKELSAISEMLLGLSRSLK